jgi:hypothetical protein
MPREVSPHGRIRHTYICELFGLSWIFCVCTHTIPHLNLQFGTWKLDIIWSISLFFLVPHNIGAISLTNVPIYMHTCYLNFEM